MASLAERTPHLALPEPVPATGSPSELERDQPLSRSLLWTLQRTWFEQQGIRAWQDGGVPHYVTNNPFLAHAYARVVHGYLRDCRARGDHDPAHPIDILELGGGTGRFAYLFVRALLELERGPAPGGVPFRYVLTDLSEANVAFWRAHPALAPWLSSGLLECARFDVEQDEAPTLPSGRPLGHAPLVVIANYFFDGLPTDFYFASDGQLQQALVSLRSAVPLTPTMDNDRSLLSTLELEYRLTPAAPGHQGDPEFDRLLEAYRLRFEAAWFAFPIGALRCCRRLRQLGGDRLLLLSADKGFVDEASNARAAPALALHGSVSVEVNFHALAGYFLGAGGDVLHPTHAGSALSVVGCLLGEGSGGHVHTRDAFAEAITALGPDDFYALRSALLATVDSLDPRGVLALLRLGRHDPQLLLRCLPGLERLAPAATPDTQQALCAAIDRTWANYYAIGESEDLPFAIGLLLGAMGRYAGAARYFERSQELHGPNVSTLYNLALCARQCGHHDEVARLVEQALLLDPHHAGALELKARLAR